MSDIQSNVESIPVTWLEEERIIAFIDPNNRDIDLCHSIDMVLRHWNRHIKQTGQSA